MIARLRLWWRMVVLRSEIAGYDDDLETLLLFSVHDEVDYSITERVITELRDEAIQELYFCTRQALQITNQRKNA